MIRRLLLALALVAAAGAAEAANCNSYPFTLTNGTTADATQVMANFNNILNCGNNNLAKSGANSDITSLSALSTPLSVVQGGTGAATLTINNVLLGNGTGALQVVAPSTNGNLLISNGTTWTAGPFAPSSLPTKATPLTTDSIVIMDAAAANAGKTATFSGAFASMRPSILSGSVQQVQTFERTDSTTGTTVLPFDDTIPQSGEGDQYLTVTITPTNAASVLIIDVVLNVASSSSGQMTAALFQDATANALAAVTQAQSAGDNMTLLTLRFKMTAGTTSATTFKVRAGLNGGNTTTLNGRTGVRQLGGVMTSYISVTEILP